MQYKRFVLLFSLTGIFLVLASGVWLATAMPASAQCGSQASTCKSCHEVQGENPVNGDGTAWHTSHAFGDFCYICHAGNNQAKEKDASHAGMVAPLEDIKASCQQCHPGDLAERAQVYADELGVEVGSGSAPAEPVAAAPVAAAQASGGEMVLISATEIDYDDPNLVDYTARYNEIVLGKESINWGNTILLGMIGLLVVGGGGFVITREELVKISFGEVKKAGDEYPAEVVEMLPAIARLKSNSRKALKNVIQNPKADKMLGLMDTLVSGESPKADENSSQDKE